MTIIRSLLIGAAIGTAIVTATAPALARDDYQYGPKPDWARYKELAEAALRAKLPEPASWSIEWPNGYVAGWWRHKGKIHGYTTCGVLHAIVPIDGRYPRVNFVAVVDHDKVQTIDISQKTSNSAVNVICEGAVRRGGLPPASLMEGVTAASAPLAATGASTAALIAASPLGLSLRPMPEGASVTAVEAGSAAARAGLGPGMVITAVNGVTLSGMGAAAVKVVDSAGLDATLTLVDGKTVKLGTTR